jgi:hypothetical protein
MEWYGFLDGLLFLWLCGCVYHLAQRGNLNLNQIRLPFFWGLSFVLARSVFHFIQSRFVEGYFRADAFSSSFGNINMLAEYLVLTIPLLVYYCQSKDQDERKRLVSLILFAASLFVLVWGRSRSSWLGLVLVGGYYLKAKQWRKSHFLIAGSIGVLTLMLQFYWSDGELNFVQKGKVSSNSARWSLVQSSLELIREKPFGIGTELFEFYIAPYRVNTERPQDESVLDRSPHNEFLRWGVEYGWFYLAGVFIALSLLMWRIIKFREPLFIGILLAFIPQLAFQFPFQNAFPFGFAALMLGLFMSSEARSSDRSGIGELSPWFTRIVASLMLGLIGVTLILFISSKYDEVHSMQDLARSERACQIYPVNWRSCINVAQNYFNQEKHKESLEVLYKELERHPFNIIALRFAVLNQLKLGNEALACEGADVYQSLLAGKGLFGAFFENVCRGQSRFLGLADGDFEKAYFRWIEETKMFEASKD